MNEGFVLSIIIKLSKTSAKLEKNKSLVSYGKFSKEQIIKTR